MCIVIVTGYSHKMERKLHFRFGFEKYIVMDSSP